MTRDNSCFKEETERIRNHCANHNTVVAVRCITYNQERYIRDALEGFVMQQTDFNFVVIVHDDASTDSTPKIIKEYSQKYPELIFPILEKENQYSKGPGNLGNVLNPIIEATNAKYIALCEGDDYWIDPLKLQKQVDKMESDPEIGMCYTGFDIKDEVRGKYLHNLFKTDPKTFPPTYRGVEEFILKRGYVCPPSWVIRRELWKSNLPLSVDGTFVRFADFLNSSKVHFLPDVTCVYRVIAESASHSKSYETYFKRQKKILDTQLRLIKHFNLSDETRDLCLSSHYKYFLKSYVINQKHREVMRARVAIKDKGFREKILFTADASGFGKLLNLIKKLKSRSATN